MSKITRPEPQALFDQYRDLVSNTILGGGEVIPESNEWYLTAMQYAQGESWYAIADQFRQELDPRTACADNLVDLAARDGVFPRPARQAQGFVNLTGTPSGAIPSPANFLIDGRQFSTTSIDTQPTALDTSGVATIRVVAVAPGIDGNVAAGSDADLDPPAATVTSVEVAGQFCEGAEVETTEEFRARYQRRLQFTPRATSDFVRNRLAEWPCVTRVIDRVGACCVPDDPENLPRLGCSEVGCGDCGCSDCANQMQYYVMFDGAFKNGIAPESVLGEVERWMFGSPQSYGLGQVEVGVCGRIVQVTPVTVDVVVSTLDCPTQRQIDTIRNALQDFFTTVEPAQPLNTEDVTVTLQRLLGGGFNFSVEFIPTDPTLFFGGQYGHRVDTSLVKATPCGLEPECDVMMVANSITVRTTDGNF